MFKNQPKGLFALALANTGERFGYYTMLAIFLLFIQAKFGFDAAVATQIYSIFLAGVYFMPLFGGMLADRIGFGRCVTLGIAVMFLGYLCLAIPTGADTVGKIMMFGALALIAIGTGLFKGNLQVMVGNLYDDPKYADKRDSAFSLFYMAINIGAMFAPSMAKAVTNFFLGKSGLFYDANIPAIAHQILDGNMANADKLTTLMGSMSGAAGMDITQFSSMYIEKLSTAYNYGFGVACISLIISVLIYFSCRSWFKHADVNAKQLAKANNGAAAVNAEPELSKEQTKSRITALMLVFAVVIFFWMAFHQNGATLTIFARDYTSHDVFGLTRIGFNIWSLALIAVSIYTLFNIFQSDSKKGKIISGVVTAALWGGAYALYAGMPEPVKIQPSDFQQFNPFFVVALTPVSLAIFGALASKGKEPSAPRKIGMGMLVAAIGFLIMTMGSMGLASPKELGGAVSDTLVSPNWLISTYLVLTFAELLLSPMGISFVSKVAPPKYKGAMMGCWFAATAIGNYLVSIPGLLWNKIPLWGVWSVLIALCLVSAIFIFSIMKKLETATK
ncbi:MAG: peptide MFS transporter [Bacteroidetes bacterium]|uniref:Peptide MFS transporter n=1 Tax=Candidatus Cryptobacteroides faecigallinarum TaxID=2840763 RepID=A0A9D9NIU4_9BACT|nr:peptide MFS transporter [Candidatus Cryptobacteroides faecigallinarum]